MRDSKPLKVLYKLTEEALALSSKLNIPLGLESKEIFNSNFYIRAIIKNPLEIPPKELVIINTGLHIIINDPLYEVVINSHINLLKDKNLAIFPCNYYKYGNELLVFMYNYSNTNKTIYPGDKIGILSFKEVITVETENIDLKYKDGNYVLENLLKKGDYLFTPKDHSWVQKEKSNVNKVSLSPKLAAEINSKRILKDGCYLCIEENEGTKTSIFIKKGTEVIVKKIRDINWRKVLTNEGHLGWIRNSYLEPLEKSITQGETINSLVEKRLK